MHKDERFGEELPLLPSFTTKNKGFLGGGTRRETLADGFQRGRSGAALGVTVLPGPLS